MFLEIELPDRVMNALVAKYNYSETVADDKGVSMPNPVKKEQFVADIIAGLAKFDAKMYEAEVNAVVARQQTIAEYETNVVIISKDITEEKALPIDIGPIEIIK